MGIVTEIMALSIVELRHKNLNTPFTLLYLRTKMTDVATEMISRIRSALDEFGVPYSIKNGSIYIKADLIVDFQESSSFISFRYISRNGVEIVFSVNVHGDTKFIELKAPDGKRKILHLGRNVYYNLQDKYIKCKYFEY